MTDLLEQDQTMRVDRAVSMGQWVADAFHLAIARCRRLFSATLRSHDSSFALHIESCSVESLPEDGERDRRLVRDDAVAEEVELVGVGRIVSHPVGRPIIQPTNAGFRREAPIPVGSPVGEDPVEISRPLTATSVSVAPVCFCSVQPERFPAVPEARESCVVGVGSVPRSRNRLIASGSVGPSLPSRSGIDREPLVASLARGVGSRLAAPNSVSFPRMNVVLPRAPPSLAIGVGSLLACSVSVRPDFELFRPPTCRPLCASGVGSISCEIR